MENQTARDDVAMSPTTRLAWLLVLLFLQGLYFPINRSIQGGALLATPWDALIPLRPIWAIPYLLSIPWWIGSFVWAAREMDAFLYRALLAGTIAVLLTSYAFYVLYPTYVERPPVEGSGWQAELVRFIYRNDRVNNAFPSGHTYTTMLIVLFWSRWRPHQRWLWAGIAVVVLLSTLFTGQHNLPDLVGGVGLAWAGYHFGTWWATRGLKQA